MFEPHAVVWAEEPGSIDSLWKQRLRWARGNVQVTRQFRHLWFRPQPGNRLGSVTFGLFWFCLFLLPVIMIAISASLVALYFVDFPLSWATFHLLWILTRALLRLHHQLRVRIDPRDRPAHLEGGRALPRASSAW